MSLINSLKLWIGHRTFDSYGVINVFKGVVEKKDIILYMTLSIGLLGLTFINLSVYP